MVKLVEVYKGHSFGKQKIGYELREVYVNPSHVVCMYADNSMQSKLHEGYLPEDLDKRQLFTKLQLNQGQTSYHISVVGDIHNISEKLGLLPNKQHLLHD